MSWHKAGLTQQLVQDLFQFQEKPRNGRAPQPQRQPQYQSAQPDPNPEQSGKYYTYSQESGDDDSQYEDVDDDQQVYDEYQMQDMCT